MDRCRFKGTEGNSFNAVQGAAGMNFRKLLKATSRLSASLCPVITHRFEAREQALRSFRLKNRLSDRSDQIMAFA
jgi:uncharacterized Fe-S cluster-containing radical SAM superfamily protein